MGEIVSCALLGHRLMLEASDMIAVFSEHTGGAANAAEYARHINKEVIRIAL